MSQTYATELTSCISTVFVTTLFTGFAVDLDNKCKKYTPDYLNILDKLTQDEKKNNNLSTTDLSTVFDPHPSREIRLDIIRIWLEKNAVNLLNINTVVLGGGAAEAFDLLEPSATKSLNENLFTKANPNVKILHSAPGRFAALMGCAALVLENEKEKKK